LNNFSLIGFFEERGASDESAVYFFLTRRAPRGGGREGERERERERGRERENECAGGSRWS